MFHEAFVPQGINGVKGEKGDLGLPGPQGPSVSLIQDSTFHKYTQLLVVKVQT